MRTSQGVTWMCPRVRLWELKPFLSLRAEPPSGTGRMESRTWTLILDLLEGWVDTRFSCWLCWAALCSFTHHTVIWYCPLVSLTQVDSEVIFTYVTPYMTLHCTGEARASLLLFFEGQSRLLLPIPAVCPCHWVQESAVSPHLHWENEMEKYQPQ